MSEFIDLFTRPWMGIVALAPLLFFVLRKVWKQKETALMFSDVRAISIPPTFRQRIVKTPSVLCLAAWLCISIALMGPRKGHEETKVTTEGIAISMVMDVSSSMNAKDMSSNGTDVITRYKMVENVFREFVRGNEDTGLKGRENDLISLVVFGRYVDSLSPLTLDHDFILDLMENTLISITTDIAKTEKSRSSMNPQKYNKWVQSKNPMWMATAVYEGVALGADMLKFSEQELQKAEKEGKANYSIKSKVLIVLTDGEDNASTISADEAIEVAKEFGVKIYSIAVHGQPTQRDVLGFFLSSSNKKYDDSSLRKMAEETGGRFYQATNTDSLMNIYKDIDQLEKTKISRQVSMEYSPTHRPWILAGLVLLAISLFLQNTYFRVLP